MRVRCGACQSSVTISRPGRFSCPHCGAMNQVKGPMPGQGGGLPPTPPPVEGPGPGYPGVQQPGPPPSPPPPPEVPSPRVSCPKCSFSFIVGAIETAVCPNCRAEVPVSRSS